MITTGDGRQVPGHPEGRPGWRSPLGLGPLETAIMRALWNANGWVKLQDIRESLDYHRPVAYTTVATVTGNLCSKNLVHRHRGDRSPQPGAPVWWYRAAQPETEHIGELIATLLDHSPSPAVTLAHAMATARTATKINGSFSLTGATASQPGPHPALITSYDSPPPAGEEIRAYIEAADEETLRRTLRAVAGQLDGLGQVARASHALGESAKTVAHNQHTAAPGADDAGRHVADELTAAAVEAYATSVGFGAGAVHIGYCVNTVIAALAGGLGLTGQQARPAMWRW